MTTNEINICVPAPAESIHNPDNIIFDFKKIITKPVRKYVEINIVDLYKYASPMYDEHNRCNGALHLPKCGLPPARCDDKEDLRFSDAKTCSHKQIQMVRNSLFCRCWTNKYSRCQ